MHLFSWTRIYVRFSCKWLPTFPWWVTVHACVNVYFFGVIYRTKTLKSLYGDADVQKKIEGIVGSWLLHVFSEIEGYALLVSLPPHLIWCNYCKSPRHILMQTNHSMYSELVCFCLEGTRERWKPCPKWLMLLRTFLMVCHKRMISKRKIHLKDDDLGQHRATVWRLTTSKSLCRSAHRYHKSHSTKLGVPFNVGIEPLHNKIKETIFICTCFLHYATWWILSTHMEIGRTAHSTKIKHI